MAKRMEVSELLAKPAKKVAVFSRTTPWLKEQLLAVTPKGYNKNVSTCVEWAIANAVARASMGGK